MLTWDELPWNAKKTVLDRLDDAASALRKIDGTQAEVAALDAALDKLREDPGE